ncbi:MAG: hypothetical protein ACRDID_24210 [Ktedonobacterales bacterium]
MTDRPDQPDQPETSIETAEEAAEPDTFLSLTAGSTEIYFVRHGDALPGQEEVTLGDYDAQALSELGRRQAPAHKGSPPRGFMPHVAQSVHAAINCPNHLG